ARRGRGNAWTDSGANGAGNAPTSPGASAGPIAARAISSADHCIFLIEAMRPGDTVSLRIEKPAAGGWMIARSDGQVILVMGVLPAERAAVHIDRIGKGVAYGHATSIEESSKDRRPAFVDPACGGCLYAHINYARQLDIKAQVIADALVRIGG